MTRKFFAFAAEIVAAWAEGLGRRGIDPTKASKPLFDDIVDASELGVRLFEHLCAKCRRDLLVTDESTRHPDFPNFMRALDAAMRDWQEAAAKLAAVITRDFDIAMTPPETQALVLRAAAVGRAIEKVGSRGLQFADFRAEFSGFENPSDESHLPSPGQNVQRAARR